MKNPHDLLKADHAALRKQAEAVQSLIDRDAKKLSEALAQFQSGVQKHFRREEIYYRVLDNGKRVDDRGLMHQLRNDHAAVIFSIESLVIRLRKNGVTPEWRAKLKVLMDVFLPHLDTEEKQLFSKGTEVLTSAELADIIQQIEQSA